jgi:hypothetical protein
MATAAQIHANRANAQKSTGPRTAGGKTQSRLNSITHGLTGTHCLRTPAEEAALDAFFHRLLPDLNPSTELQLEIARRVVYTMFRLAQVSVIETNIYALGRANSAPAQNTRDAARLDSLSQAKTFIVEGKAFSNLSLYEQRLDRSMHKDLDLLHKLQREASAQQLKPRPATVKPAAQPIDPIAPKPEIGFVYSTAYPDPPPPPPSASNNLETMAA